MKAKHEIILSYLEKGVEVCGDYTRKDIEIPTLEYFGSVNIIRRDNLFHLCLREIKPNSWEDEWDRKENLEFCNLDTLLIYLKDELDLEINDLKKAKNFKYFRNK